MICTVFRKYETAGKTILAMAIFLILFSCSASTYAINNNQTDLWPRSDEINALSWMVLNADDGNVIMENNADREIFPASTIKLLTAILLLESDLMDQEVTVSQSAVNLPQGSSKVGFLAGEKVHMQDVLAALILASGNDAANVVAESIAGSIEEFAARMNQRASQLGMDNSNFTNPSGLHDPAQITTARDMGILVRQALQFNEIRDLAVSTRYAMPPTNMHPYPGWAMIFNTNRLVVFGDDVMASNYVESYLGLKTGTTNAAGSNLVAVARTHDGRELISLVFGVSLQEKTGNVFIYSRSVLEEAARKIGSSHLDDIITPTPSDTEASMTQTTDSPQKETSAEVTTVRTENGEEASLSPDYWQTTFIVLLSLLALLLLVCGFYISYLRGKLRMYKKYNKQRRG